jgi:hypothetical protein
MTKNPRKKFIYTVTGLFRKREGSGFHYRNFGFQFTLKEARASIRNNDGDMNECNYYNHLCIAKKHSGMFSIAGLHIMEWYKWNGKSFELSTDPRSKEEKQVIFD